MADTSDSKPESPTTLGVSVDPTQVTAVLLHVDGSLEPVQLGATELHATAAVAQSPDGAVLVGEAALRSSGPIATDPMNRARAGRVGALTAVLAHVVGRATASAGSTPRRLALVVPDDWNRDERDRLVQTGAAAGVTDVVLVPATVAQSRRPEVDPAVALAAAAALVARSADIPPPIVTREDFGGVVGGPAVRPPGRAPESPKGPRSVFDQTSVPPTAATPRPGAASGISSAADPTRAMSRVAPPDAPLFEEPDRRAPIGLLIAVAVLIAAGAVIGVVALARSGSSGSVAPVTTTTAATTTTLATTTTAATTTSSSTTTSSTSTTTSSTSTTSTTTTSTTTIPLPVGEPGPVTLVETGLQLDTGAVLTFGQDDKAVIDAINGVLGGPDLDSGWYETSFCIGARTRILDWGNLEVVFTEDVLDSGVGKFTQWFVDGIGRPVGLVTVDGLGYGATVGFLNVTYGTAVTVVEAIPDDPSGLFAVTNPASGGVLLGTTSTRDPDGLVTALWAGDSCTRIYT